MDSKKQQQRSICVTVWKSPDIVYTTICFNLILIFGITSKSILWYLSVCCLFLNSRFSTYKNLTNESKLLAMAKWPASWFSDRNVSFVITLISVSAKTFFCSRLCRWLLICLLWLHLVSSVLQQARGAVSCSSYVHSSVLGLAGVMCFCDNVSPDLRESLGNVK